MKVYRAGRLQLFAEQLSVFFEGQRRTLRTYMDFTSSSALFQCLGNTISVDSQSSI